MFCVKQENMKSKLLADITPGEILDEEFLKPMAIPFYKSMHRFNRSPHRRYQSRQNAKNHE